MGVKVACQIVQNLANKEKINVTQAIIYDIKRYFNNEDFFVTNQSILDFKQMF